MTATASPRWPAETNYEHAMRAVLAHSVSCFAARRQPGEDYVRACSESHLAGAVAYVLAALHDNDQGAADDVAVSLNEWASDGEELNAWVAKHAAFFGLDVDALITAEQSKPAAPSLRDRASDPAVVAAVAARLVGLLDRGVAKPQAASIARSAPMFGPIRDTIGGVAVCAQNGAYPENLPWSDIDAVFLAGIVECVDCGWVPDLGQLPTETCLVCLGRMREWKLGPVAAAVTAEARRRGVWVHMGRVNSWRRLQYAYSIGCDSADGTYLAFGPDKNLPTLLGWLDEAANQLPWGVAA